MESNLIDEFIQQTNTDEGVAHAFLQAKNWDLSRAIQSYNFIRDSIIYSSEENNEHAIDNTNEIINCSKNDEKQSVKLKRGISKASYNEEVVSSARANIALDYEKIFTPVDQSNSQPGCTFVLPNLFVHPDNFKEFIEQELVEVWSMGALEHNNRLNWWVEKGICQRLWPLITTGDGNCLLHAASLAMWGFHDRLLTLRKALYNFLIESKMVNGIKRRWKYHLGKVNSEVGFFYSENEWENEWSNIINLASPRPRNESNMTYESLEEVHILALAHVLKRTIIVISDTMLKNVNGEDLSPINFGGIYIPLEVPYSEVYKSPINLIFDSGHFSALVPMDQLPSQDNTISSNLITAIPLMDFKYDLLPLRFADDPGDHQNLSIFYKTKEEKIHLLNKYLDILEIDLSEMDEEKENSELENNNLKNINGSEKENDFTLSSETITEDNYSDSNKNKASKQIHSVAKQFGSIGKSMGKRFRSITKLARASTHRKEDHSINNTSTHNNSIKKSNEIIICAQINTNDRHPCNEKLIHNYLDCAKSRFIKHSHANPVVLPDEGIISIKPPCVSPGCNQLGSITNNYLCVDCYFKQLSATRESLGNSKFYTYPESNIFNTKDKIHSAYNGNNRDKTIHASKSTFYTDISPELIQQPKKTMILTKSPTPINEHDLELPQNLYRQVNTTPILASKHSYHVNNYEHPTLGGGSPVASAVALRSYNLASNWETKSNVPSFQNQGNSSNSSIRILDGNTTSITSSNIRHSLPTVEADRLSSRSCKVAGCNYFGAGETEFYCSRCYKELIKNQPSIKSLQVKEIKR